MNDKITFIFAFHLVVGCGCNYIQKCCDLHQQLSTNFDDCINFDGTVGIDRYEIDQTNVDKDGINFIKMGKKDRHHIWWLPPEVQFLAANASGAALQPLPLDKANDIRILYNRKNPCQEFSQILLPFNDDVYLLDNGSLLVTGIADNVRPQTMVFPQNVYCLDRVSLIPSGHRRRRSTNQLLDHGFAIFVCPSLAYSCIRMCCHKRNYLEVQNGSEKCEYASAIPVTWSLNYIDYNGKTVENSRNFGILEGIPRCDDHYYLNDNSSARTKNFWILPDGSVRVENRSTDIGASDYCIHFINVRGHYQPNLRVCADTFEQNAVVLENRTAPVRARSKAFFQRAMAQQTVVFKDLLYEIYFVVGAIFLALTLLVYACALKRRTSTFDKILSWHIGSLLVCYSTMAFDKIVRPSTKMWSCELTGYVIQYTFMASTLWLNIMCLCIYHSFRGYNIVSHGGGHLNKSNKYFHYSIYAWGGAAIISFGTFLMDNTDILDSNYQPKFGVHSCWLQNSSAQLIYFYAPLAVILASNLVLFIITLKKIFAMQNKTRELNTLDSKKYVGKNEVSSKSLRISLFIRLFSLTGITWIFEIVSWYVGGPDYYWYITDAINSLRGVFVFIICCCKKEVLFTIFKRPATSGDQKNGIVNRLSHTSGSETRSTSVSSIQMVSVRHGSEASAEESA